MDAKPLIGMGFRDLYHGGAWIWHALSNRRPMTLRITVSALGPPTTIKVDGRLTGTEVPELRRVPPSN